MGTIEPTTLMTLCTTKAQTVLSISMEKLLVIKIIIRKPIKLMSKILSSHCCYLIKDKKIAKVI